MKKRIFISALIAFTLIFGNITVLADNSDISLNDDGYEYSDYDNYEYPDDYDYEYSDEYYDEYDNDYYTYNSYDENYGNYTVVETSPVYDEEASKYFEEHPELLEEYKHYSDSPKTFFEQDYYLDETVYYRDESKRFTDSQKQQIIDLLKNTSKQIGFNLAVYTGRIDRTDKRTNDFTEMGAKVIFGSSPKTGTVFLYVDLDGYYNAYDDMYSYREPFLYYSGMYGEDDTEPNTRLDKILAAMQSKFPAGGAEIRFDDIYAGLKVYCEKLVYYKELGPEDNIYYYNSDTDKYIYALHGDIYESDTIPRPFKHFWIVLIISIIAGIITFATMFFGVKNSYKFKTPVSASEYTSSNKTFVNNKVDLFVGSRISKVRISSSSSGGGSHHSGGGGHRGGGHSGGGGGGRHR